MVSHWLSLSPSSIAAQNPQPVPFSLFTGSLAITSSGKSSLIPPARVQHEAVPLTVNSTPHTVCVCTHICLLHWSLESPRIRALPYSLWLLWSLTWGCHSTGSHSSKASILRCSAFFIVQLSQPYMTTGKTIALTRWTFVGKVVSAFQYAI